MLLGIQSRVVFLSKGRYTKKSGGVVYAKIISGWQGNPVEIGNHSLTSFCHVMFSSSQDGDKEH